MRRTRAKLFSLELNSCSTRSSSYLMFRVNKCAANRSERRFPGDGLRCFGHDCGQLHQNCGNRVDEHQATGALPQSADSTGSAGHHLVERDKKTDDGLLADQKAFC